MSYKKMLVVGSSETSMFWKGRQFLKEMYGVEVQVDCAAGRKLDECVVPTIAKMEKDTSILIIWALTPWAWKKQAVHNGKKSVNIFVPRTSYNLKDVAPIMERIVGAARSANSACQVYLSIPAIKDMYTFNKTRVRRAWGDEAANCLKGNGLLGPKTLQNHSIKVYHDFESLVEDKSEYWWTGKNCLRGNFAFTRLYRSTNRKQGQERELPPHRAYITGQSQYLNVSALPDGLHGNQDFLVAFCKQHQKIFQDQIQNRNLIMPDVTYNVEIDTDENSEEETLFSEPLDTQKSKREPIVLNFGNGKTLRTHSGLPKVVVNIKDTSPSQKEMKQVSDASSGSGSQKKRKWQPIVFDLKPSEKQPSTKMLTPRPIMISKQKQKKLEYITSFNNAWKKAVTYFPDENENSINLNEPSKDFDIAWKRAVKIDIPDSPEESQSLSPNLPQRVPPFGTNQRSLHQLVINNDCLTGEQPSTSTDIRFLPPLTVQIEQDRTLSGGSDTVSEEIRMRAMVRKIITSVVTPDKTKEEKEELFKQLQKLVHDECTLSKYEDAE